MSERIYNTAYSDSKLNHLAFPLGGIGAGMLALEGTGTLSHFSLRNRPDIANEPTVFSAVCIKSKQGNVARVLEGPVPAWKVFGYQGRGFASDGGGLNGKQHYGLPRFAKSSFEARFPFGSAELRDDRLPIEVAVTGWSPFIPLDADHSSLPVAALEYGFTNPTDEPIELVYSFHAANFMKAEGSDNHRVERIGNGFTLVQPQLEGKPWEQGAFAATTDHPSAKVDPAWFRGGWFDALTLVWKTIEEGLCPDNPPFEEGPPSQGGSLYVPLTLAPGEAQTVRLMLSWYVPETNLSIGGTQGAGKDGAPVYHRPWYAGRFASIADVAHFWMEHYDSLRERSASFRDCLYDSTLPPEAMEAVTANLTILKSPTVLRQTDGRLWGWEGCMNDEGSCHGSCTHVWNYAQAIPHLFPELESGLRETELNEGQDDNGHQNFRVPIPIQPADHLFHAASDGQLGGLMKLYREWRISGDTEWLKRLWPQAKRSLAYAIKTWDPDGLGVLREPHHNTYDIEFWGPDGMCSSIYLGALKAASLIAQAAGDEYEGYERLYAKGRAFLENELFNGEYFEQRIEWEGLHTPSPLNSEQAWNVNYAPEAVELLQLEGPKYQYGKGCLSDGVIGAWLAEMCGLGDILDRDKVRSHLLSVYRYNLKRDLSEHANPQRPGYALGHEGGLLLCTWPRGDRLSLPFVYSDEVWTGIEYQVASHLLALGCVEEGLDIVRVCRDRYDGTVRNPFDEYECGHWYARAMASYGLIQGWSGIRYDACDRTLHVRPAVSGDYRSFLCTATGYGLAGIRDGEPFVEVRSGSIPVDRVLQEGQGI